MKWLRYDGPGHVLKVSDTLYLGLGSAAPVDDDLAKTIVDNPEIYGNVTVIDGPTATKSSASEKKPAETTDTKEK